MPNHQTPTPVVTTLLDHAVVELQSQGWVSAPTPSTRRPHRQVVVLVGPGGVLVIGSHKTADSALADLTATVTALLPAHLRAHVISENGHDVRSLPRFAADLEQRLDTADRQEAATCLQHADRLPLTVGDVLEQTRDAAVEPRGAGRRHDGEESALVRAANALVRHSIALSVLLVVAVISVMAISTSTQPSQASSTTHPGTSSSAPASSPESRSTTTLHDKDAPPTTNR